MKTLFISGLAAAVLASAGTAVAATNTIIPDPHGCHVDTVAVEGATINGHVYVTVKAPGGCGAGVRPNIQSWKIVVRDANGTRTIYRHGGSAMGQIKTSGNAVTVWARYTLATRGASPVPFYGHRTLYLGQG